MVKKNPWKVKLQTPSSKRKRALRREKKRGGIIVDYIYFGILIKEPIKITESV